VRCGDDKLATEKIVLKSALKMVPGFGWGMQHFCFLFLQRDWQKDEPYMAKALGHFVRHEYPLQLLIFPEGTDLSPTNQQKSNQFASIHQLPSYNYVLHPRVRGLQHALHCLGNSVDYLYDITLGYPDLLPQSEVDLFFKGKLPHEVHFFIKKYAIADIPVTNEGIETWCATKWQEKEDRLREFYKTKHFLQPDLTNKFVPVRRKLFTAAIFWILFVCFTSYLLYSSFAVQIYFMIGVLVEVLLTICGGVDYFETWFHKPTSHNVPVVTKKHI